MYVSEMLAAVTAAEVEKFAERKGLSWEEKGEEILLLSTL